MSPYYNKEPLPPKDFVDDVVVERLKEGKPIGRTATKAEKHAAFHDMAKQPGFSVRDAALLLKLNWATATSLAAQYDLRVETKSSSKSKTTRTTRSAKGKSM